LERAPLTHPPPRPPAHTAWIEFKEKQARDKAAGVAAGDAKGGSILPLSAPAAGGGGAAAGTIAVTGEDGAAAGAGVAGGASGGGGGGGAGVSPRPGEDGGESGAFASGTRTR